MNLTEEEIKKQALAFREKKKIEEPNNPFTEKLNEHHEINDEAIKKFKDPKLLEYINGELSKDHLGDTPEKMTMFLTLGTSQLEPPELRQSASAGGDPAAGKNNMVNATLKHFPKEKWILLTNATIPTMEDDISGKDIIAFNELNMQGEHGANNHLIEVFKQLSEGGTHSLKKDLATGYRTTKDIRQEQKTLIFTTTEETKEEQLDTRFINIVLSGSESKNKVVNDYTLQNYADLNKILQKTEEKPSWICLGINQLKKYPVWIPYANILKGGVFDSRLSRSKRDVKRIMALTSAITWLYQLQRNRINFKGKEFLISEPEDFLSAILISGKFFNETYSGLEPRLQEILDFMPSHEKIERSKIQSGVGIKSKNTIKNRIKILSDLGFVKYEAFDGQNKNEVFYKKLSTCKKSLVNLKIEELISKFDNYNLTPDLIPNDTFLTSSEGVKLDITGCQRVSKDIKKGLFYEGCQESNNSAVSVDKIGYEQTKQKTLETASISENLTPSNLTPLCFIEDTESFDLPDGSTTPFYRMGDKASLPPQIAEILIKSGKAIKQEND